MTTRIMIEQCHPDHGRVTTATEAEIEALAISIRDGGMKHPILALPNGSEGYIVVDGLARIAAASKLGLVTIEAMVTESLDQACRLLERTNAKRDVPIRRAWEVSRAVEPLHWKRRSETFNLHKAGETKERMTGSDLIAKAFGLRSGAQLKVIRQVFRLAEELGDTEIIAQLDDGAGLYLVRNQLRALAKGKKMPPPLESNTKVQQLILLTNAARSMGTTLKAINDSTTSIGVTEEQLAPIVNDLRKHRAFLSRIIHNIEKEVPSV